MPPVKPILSYRAMLEKRAALYAAVRDFFAKRQVLEVETPIFSYAGNTDPNISSLIADFAEDSSDRQDLRYAHTSPEFAMKRLMTYDVGSIYQICKVFRKGEIGARHNPEFTMLEWYRPGIKYFELMDEISDLMAELGISQNIGRFSYAEVFMHYLNLDVLNADVDELKRCAQDNNIEVVGYADHYDDWTALLLAHLIEPKLGFDNPVFIYDYPYSQAALANIREQDRVAERFELYVNGIELANGYQELTDASEYHNRFIGENKTRLVLGLDQVVVDKRLITDLSSGFPDSSGVALGMDRLLMVLMGVENIDNVLPFAFYEK